MNLEKIKAYLTDFRISIPVGVVLGLILGLIIGWGIWPVQWTDLAPYHLRPDLREDYLRMSIYTTTKVGNESIATKAWAELEDTAEETLAAVMEKPKFLNEDQITSFMAIVGAEGVAEPDLEEDLPVVTEEEEVLEEVDDGRGPNWLLIGGLCILLLLVLAVVFYFFVLRDSLAQKDQPEPLSPRTLPDEDVDFDEDANRFTVLTPHEDETPKAEPVEPVAQFMTIYMVGDDFYDDSFSIDAPTGEFLGECGVGISETVGVGEPKRVTAFEIWLFDKNDIQTVTKVIMSKHAHDDEKIRVRLESKGEPVLAEPGKQVLLETATLQLEARIIDMEYGEGAAPDQSYFQRLTLELAVWPK